MSANLEDLTRLLLRLDSDTTRAWQKYEEIRRRLAKFFEWNHCARPEDLADEVLDRVAAKPDSKEIREVQNYSLAVARFVRLEAHKKERREIYSEDLPGGENALPDAHNQSGEIVDRVDEERRLACLRQCLAGLMFEDRELAIQYYSAEEKKQMALREKLAKKAGLTLGALRKRMNRLRAQLEPCVKRCLESRREWLSRVS